MFLDSYDFSHAGFHGMINLKLYIFWYDFEYINKTNEDYENKS